MDTEPPTEGRPKGEPSDPTRKTDEKVGWIDGLAQRSTGLPPASKRSDDVPKPSESGAKSPSALAGVGIQFGVTTAVFAFIGVYLDRQFGWTPWGTVGLSILGFVGGLYLLIKEFLKDQGGK